MTDLISPEDLSRFLKYDPDTGVLVWKKRSFENSLIGDKWNARFAGKVAGGIDQKGYNLLRINYRAYRAHRVAYAIHYGFWPKHEIDHINGVRSDNRIANLRDVTGVENRRNQKIRTDNSSGSVGVRWHKGAGKWVARIVVGGKEKHLGCFLEKRDALKARKNSEVKYGFHPNHGRVE